MTCEIRYKLDLTKLAEFEAYARAWTKLIERHGGIHNGYFMPRPIPDGAGISFPKVGSDGAPDVAVALFSFPDEAAYRVYRKAVADDPECGPAADLYNNTEMFPEL